MNHALARLKKASTISSGSHASSSQPSSGVDGHGNLLPSYSPGQRGQGAPLPMAEKTLPPGAAAYSHPSTRWDQAQRERDELERAIKLSEEQDQVHTVIMKAKATQRLTLHT